MLYKYSIVNFKEPIKQQKQLWTLFHKFRKIPMGMSAVKFSAELFSANMEFS